MAYTTTWNAAFEATPANTDLVSGGDDRIRELKNSVRERLAKDHYMEIAGTDADHGEHQKITFQSQIAKPTNVANKGFLYTKDVSAKVELHWEDEDGNEVALTSAGKIPVTAGGTGVVTHTTAYGLLAAGTTATGPEQTLPAGLTTQILVGGGASALPSWGTDIPTAVTIGSAYIYRASGTDVPVADGGTGASTLTDHGLLLGNGTSAVSALAEATDGQLPIGDTGGPPILATLTAGDGIDVTNAAGSITIATDLKSNGGLVIESTELAVDLGASSITGTLAVGDGGTGATTLATNGILYGNATSAVQVTTAAASSVLVTNGSNVPSLATDIPTAVTIGTKYIYRADGTDVPVADGGTGRSTGTTAYALVATGTTATGAQQTLAAGATTEILVGGGASALPVWTTATGSGSPVRATSPTLVTPVLGTPSSGTLDNCTTATATDNDADTTLASTAFAKSQDAVLAREPDQGVALTAAASGSSGITVADNDNIDFGTGNFTLVWKGSLPDWTPSALQSIIHKYGSGTGPYVEIGTTGLIRCGLSGTYYSSTIGEAFADNTVHEITVVVTRETASVAGSVSFYTDGVLLGDAVVITAGAPPTNSNTTALNTLGYSGVRTAGTVHNALTYNRALTAAEVLDLYRNGPKVCHLKASQTAVTSGTLLLNQEYTIDTYNTDDDFSNIATVVSGTINTAGCIFVTTGTTPTHWAHSSSLRATGATLALLPEGIQPNRWLDASTNYLNATFPTTGWSLTRPIPYQPVLTNLLTNSQVMACSGSGLTQGAGSGRQTDFNVSNILADADGSTAASWTGANCTITDAGANLLLTATASAAASATYTLAGLTVGKLYKAAIVTANGTHSWDSATDTLTATSNAGTAISGATIALNAGTNSFIWEATETNNKVKISIGAFTNTETLNVTSIYVDEVTPGYVAADTLAPDTMTKTSTLDLHQYWNSASANTYGYGTYNLKATKGADGAEYLNFGTAINYRDLQGRAVALGCWVYSVTSSSNVKLSIHDGVSEIAISSSYCPANTLTWMEITGTCATNASAITPRVLFDGSTSDVAYISEPMFVKGSSIGRGNYQPIVNEVIAIGNASSSSTPTLLSNTAPASSTTTLNVEALSSGMIGKGVKAVELYIEATNTAAMKYIGFKGSAYNYNLMHSQVANIRCSDSIKIYTDSSGDLTLIAEDANWSAVTVRIYAIQT